MAAIGRFQKGDDVFHAKIVEGKLYRLIRGVFGAPSFEREPTHARGLETLPPVEPSQVLAVGLNYLEPARDSGNDLLI